MPEKKPSPRRYDASPRHCTCSPFETPQFCTIPRSTKARGSRSAFGLVGVLMLL